ncbi:type I polyketide synthase [Paenibacillus sp. FJAT-26967]|uniref:type I polyketide synthase n=1 Tax=Paenibacillus sp. FJAT-26967 TaxID=1729690 RepID=UPI000838CAD8|nr:type I polyketide synthase [Paenibacillus sp. FJAT-26967]
MNKVYEYVIENAASGLIEKNAAVQIVKMLKQRENKRIEEIAIIGMSVKFPKADGVEQFWHNLREGIDCVSGYPDGRRENIETLLGTNAKQQPVQYSSGSYLDEIDTFDYSFFGMSPNEARLMDPNQRLFLQTAWQAIEDSGYSVPMMKGTRTGVYVGHSSDFGESYKKFVQEIEPSMLGASLTGNIKSVIAGRVSYLLDLKGPSMMIDTACSSSLVAVHTACQGIKNGECEMALAGGIKINLLPVRYEDEVEVGIQSSDGKARSFDDSSSGTGMGEGVAVILLKPLKKALSDGDCIHAVIKGSAINQDGASIGMTAPNVASQADVIRRSWAAAKIEPDTVSYIEAHGTGTKLGDPIEIEGIEMAFKTYSERKQFCAVGSIKTNLGHLDHAAGIAGLIKCVLALKHRELPPSLHFKRPNRRISFDRSPVYVQDRLSDWRSETSPLRCGVSSFGLSGTNCHIVLEESPERPEGTLSAETLAGVPAVLTLSAKSISALNALLEDYTEFLKKAGTASLVEICATAASGREHYGIRLAIVSDSKEALLDKLRNLHRVADEPLAGDDVYFGRHQIVVNQKKKASSGTITEETRKQRSREADSFVSQVGEQDQPSRELLRRICDLYVAGADVDWSRLFGRQRIRKVNLPTYPFDKSRCWLAPSPVQEYQKKLDHPLLDYAIDMFDRTVYVTHFSAERHWEIGEHVVGALYVLPGTAYLEMVRAASSLIRGEAPIRMEDVMFLAPLAVGAGESREAQLHLIRQDSGGYEFVVVSKEESGAWTKHAEGRFTWEVPAYSTKADYGHLIGRYPVISIEDSSHNKNHFIQTGGHWRTLRKLYSGSDELLSFFKLPKDYEDERYRYGLHPSLMDCAVNIAIDRLSSGGYLPFYYKRMDIYECPPGEVYSYITRITGSGHSETQTYSIVLMDGEGKLLVHIEGYTVKKVPDYAEFGTASPVQPYNEVIWEVSYDEVPPAEPIEGCTLVLHDGDDRAEALCRELQAGSADVVEARWGEGFEASGDSKYRVSGSEADYIALFRALKGRRIGRLLHLLTMGDSGAETAADLRMNQAKGTNSLFYLVRAMHRASLREPLECLVVTSCAYEMSGAEQTLNPGNASLIGLAKVVEQETGSISCRCIDLDEQTPVSVLLKELSAVKAEPVVGYRSGIRYRQQFQALDLGAAEEDPIPIRASGVYIITGGTGGIGLEIGRYLAAQSQVQLCLINRSEMPDRQQWNQWLSSQADTKTAARIRSIMEIERTGSKVSCYRADVADEDSLARVLDVIRQEHGAIHGIVHSAGVAGDGMMVLRKPEAFEQVIGPKIYGTWNLDHLTRGDRPHFFIMFSSVTALTGGLGQGDYTAANTYLDAYAAYRTRAAGRTVTINWPAWKETGMAVEYGVQNQRNILFPVSTAEAIEMFAEITGKNVRHVIAGRIDNDFLRQTEPMSDRKNSQPAGEVSSDTAARSSIEAKVSGAWSRTLGIPDIDLHDQFSDIGGDSIMASLLLKEIDKEFPGLMDITDIFAYPTIEQMSVVLDQRMDRSAEAAVNQKQVEPEEPAAEAEPGVEQIMERLASGEISMNEAEYLLSVLSKG